MCMWKENIKHLFLLFCLITYKLVYYIDVSLVYKIQVPGHNKVASIYLFRAPYSDVFTFITSMQSTRTSLLLNKSGALTRRPLRVYLTSFYVATFFRTDKQELFTF